MESIESSQLLKKIEILVKLSAANAIKDHSFREQVRLLSTVGLPPREIAQLVGKSPNSVRVMLSAIKKQKGVNV